MDRTHRRRHRQGGHRLRGGEERQRLTGTRRRDDELKDMRTARRWAWVIGTALGAVLLCIGTALLVPAHAAPKASSAGLAAEGTYAGAGGSITWTFETAFECNAHASVPVTATAIDSCALQQ